ncbi:MAG: NADAR family protein [Nanoarchaeota archaeon]
MINNFSGESRYYFPSNFYPVEIKFDGITYPSVEHAYQAAKTLDKDERYKILIVGSPGEAKKLGRKLKLRENWEENKIEVMLFLLRQKFDYPKFKKWLLETGEEHLEEGNWWGDRFWGTCNGVGENWLGRLLMQVREEIK